MKNYIFDLYTVSEFKRDNPALAEKAEQALQYLKGYYPNGSEFVVIEVEGYNCVACLRDEFYPYELGTSHPLRLLTKNNYTPFRGSSPNTHFKDNRRKTQWQIISASQHITRIRTSA